MKEKSKWNWISRSNLPDYEYTLRHPIRVLEHDKKILGFISTAEGFNVMTFDKAKNEFTKVKKFKKKNFRMYWAFKWRGRPGKALIFSTSLRTVPVVLDLDLLELDNKQGSIKVDPQLPNSASYMKDQVLTQPFIRHGLMVLSKKYAKIFFLDFARPLEGFKFLVGDSTVGKYRIVQVHIQGVSNSL